MSKLLLLITLLLQGLRCIAQPVAADRILAKGYQPRLLEQATATLIARNTVSSAKPVVYKAGKTVILLTGFEVKPGSVFTAYPEAVSQLAWRETETESMRISTHPNPFDDVTRITYQLVKTGRTRLFISDAEGRLVSNLVDQQQETGQHQVEWRTGNLPTGTYVCTLDVGGERLSKRIIRK
ncbi:3-coathanger stack domain-containing protein [Spirosoma fluminis]